MERIGLVVEAVETVPAASDRELAALGSDKTRVPWQEHNEPASLASGTRGVARRTMEAHNEVEHAVGEIVLEKERVLRKE